MEKRARSPDSMDRSSMNMATGSGSGISPDSAGRTAGIESVGKTGVILPPIRRSVSRPRSPVPELNPKDGV